MTCRSRRLLALALCVLLGLGLPLYAAYAAPAADVHHATTPHGDGMPDCGSQGDQNGVDCAQFCAAVCASMAVPPVLPASLLAAARSERIVLLAVASFQSRSGPPGLQPPR